MNSHTFRFLPMLLLFILVSCNSDYTIKRRAYYRIDLPEHKYQEFNQPGFPYSFEYPVYSNVIQDTTFFEDKPENPYWINFDFPELNGKIYISYKRVNDQNFDKLVDDAFKMTYKHTYKATAIADSLIQAAVGAGIPMTVPSTTVNKVCLSGMNAIALADANPVGVTADPVNVRIGRTKATHSSFTRPGELAPRSA